MGVISFSSGVRSQRGNDAPSLVESPPFATQSPVINRRARLGFTGDSNTVRIWYDPGVFYSTPTGNGIAAKFNAVWNNAPDNVVVAAATGISGNKIADLDAGFVNRVAAYALNALFVFIGLNDATGAMATPTTPAEFRVSATSFLAKCHAYNPNMLVIWPSIFCYGSQWSAGPVWGINQYDAEILAIDNEIQTLCASFGNLWIPQRTALLNYLVTNNSPAPGLGTGIVTPNTDPQHLNTAGQQLMVDTVFAALTAGA